MNNASKVNFSVSHGTHRVEDLIPAFIAELREAGNWGQLSASDKDAVESLDGERPESWFDSWESGEAVEMLFNLLESVAPSGCYFGAHPGDGSDFGFWQCENQDTD